MPSWTEFDLEFKNSKNEIMKDSVHSHSLFRNAFKLSAFLYPTFKLERG